MFHDVTAGLAIAVCCRYCGITAYRGAAPTTFPLFAMTFTQSLFDLVGRAGALATRIEIIAADLESDDPEVVTSAETELEELINSESGNREAILAKADCWAWVIDKRRAMATARADQAKRLAILARADQAAADGMEARLVAALTKAFPAEVRFELPHHRLSSRPSEAVEVTCDPAKLPESCQRVMIEPDRTAIKAAIKAGETVPGCELVQRRSWKLS